MRRETDNKVLFLTYAAVIAALYVALTMAFQPIGFWAVQFRISEILCVLPFFTPAAIPGLFIGCFLANFLCGAAMLDVVFGSIATLIGALGSWHLRKHKWMVCVPPIIANTVIIPWVLRYAYGNESIIPFLMFTVGLGEILAIGVLGNIFLVTMERYQHIIFKRNLEIHPNK